MTPDSSQKGVGVWHKDGPLAQLLSMAEWVEEEATRVAPSSETLRKVATNIRAAAYALGASERPLTKYGWAHADDDSECMEPVWCKREHVRTRVLR